MVTATVTDEKLVFFQQALGSVSGSLSYLEWTFYSSNSGLAIPTNSLSDHKRAFFIKELGLSGAANKSLTELEVAWWASYAPSNYLGYGGKQYDFFGTQQYDPVPLISGLQAYYRADKISGQTLVSDSFDRSRNLLAGQNPGFEAGVTGWGVVNPNPGGSIASDATLVGTGLSMKIITDGTTTFQGATKNFGNVLSSNTSYTLSIKLKGVAGTKVRISITNAGVSFIKTTNNTDTGVTLTGGVDLITITGSFTTAAVNQAVFIDTGNLTQATTFYVDDVQIEVGSTATKFTWGDASNLGVADTGQAWINSVGGVIGGQKVGVLGGGLAGETVVGGGGAYVDSGSADIDISVIVSTIAGNSGILFRYVDDSNYWSWVDRATAGGGLRKIIAGVTTTVFDPGVGKDGDVLRVVASGSSITIYLNGVNWGTTVDTTFISATKHGLIANNSSGRFKNFSIKMCPCTDGQTVGCWPDLSGNNYHAQQNTYTPPNLLTQNQATVEDGTTTGWVGRGNSAVASTAVVASEGTKALIVTAVANGFWGSNSATGTGGRPATPGITYAFTVDVRTDNAVTTALGTIGCAFNWWDAAGTFLGGSASFNVTPSDTAWTTISGSATAPANTAFMSLAITENFASPAGGNAFYIDKAGIFVGTVPTWRSPSDPSGFLQRPLLRMASPNLLTYNQATIETDTTGWVVQTNVILSRVTTQASHGSAALALTSVAAGDMFAANGNAGSLPGLTPCLPNTTYTALCNMKAASISRTTRVYIRWFTNTGAFISQTLTAFTDVVTGWTQGLITATSPSNAVYMDVLIYVVGTGGAGEIHYVDQAGIFAGIVTQWLPPVTIPNQRAAVQFDGFDDKLITTLTDSPAITIIAVTQEQAHIGNPRILGFNATRSLGSFGVGNTYGWFSTQASTIASLGGPALNIGPVLGTIVETDNTTSTGYVNGTVGPTFDPSDAINAPLGIGNESVASSLNFWQGIIIALVVFNRVLTTTERQRVERFLGSRYGVAVA